MTETHSSYFGARVRPITPRIRHKVGPDETRSGIMLTFPRFE
jgi:hypothetical protein